MCAPCTWWAHTRVLWARPQKPRGPTLHHSGRWWRAPDGVRPGAPQPGWQGQGPASSAWEGWPAPASGVRGPVTDPVLPQAMLRQAPALLLTLGGLLLPWSGEFSTSWVRKKGACPPCSWAEFQWPLWKDCATGASPRQWPQCPHALQPLEAWLHEPAFLPPFLVFLWTPPPTLGFLPPPPIKAA